MTPDEILEALKPFAKLRVGRFMTDGLRYDYRIDAAWLRRARRVYEALAQPAKEPSEEEIAATVDLIETAKTNLPPPHSQLNSPTPNTTFPLNKP
jgi:hypothetical protein